MGFRISRIRYASLWIVGKTQLRCKMLQPQLLSLLFLMSSIFPQRTISFNRSDLILACKGLPGASVLRKTPKSCAGKVLTEA